MRGLFHLFNHIGFLWGGVWDGDGVVVCRKLICGIDGSKFLVMRGCEDAGVEENT